jgi:ribosomal protein RSM22 (predicted rRNA methylase)
MTLPPSLSDAIQTWLQANAARSLRDDTQALTRAYKAGKNSTRADLAAYLVARAPATFASVARAMALTAEAIPEFQPHSVLDVGAGTGSASWAAVSCWPGIAGAQFIDNNIRFLDLAKSIAIASGIPVLQNATFSQGEIGSFAVPPTDLVVASYVLAELPAEHASQLATRLWAATGTTLLIVEPGTPAGFERIKRARTALIKAGAFVAAPCTHTNVCPMAATDWCHFAVRLARTRAHMHAKSAVVPFEDEPFSFVAATRISPRVAHGRVIQPPNITRAGISVRLCTDGGIEALNIQKRDAARFRRVRKLQWGGLFRGDDT